MEKIESLCVDCQLPCIHGACLYYEVIMHYCDQCYKKESKYKIDGDDYCEDCAEKFFKDLYDDTSYEDIAKLHNICFKKYD